MTNKTKRAFAFATYLIVLSIFLTLSVLALWFGPTNGDNGIWLKKAPLIFFKFGVHPDLRMLLLVILTGALGSFVHTATSFATYIGNRCFDEDWYCWYILRPFIGVALAIIFYFTLRGGLVVFSNGDINSISPFCIGALSGLVGMFSKQATDKLREIFDNLFKTDKGDEERDGKLLELRPVHQVMLGMNRISAYQLNDGDTDNTVTIQDLYSLITGVVTRIPVLNANGSAKYIIHQSLLYKFISKKSMNSSESSVKISELTLENFMNFDNMEQLVRDSLAFVSKDKTLRDAKNEMDKISHCQDVLVTENGTKEEPILGWLTNIEISKHAKV